MGVIIHVCPGIAGGVCLQQQFPKTLTHLLLVLLVSEYLLLLDPPDYYMVQHSGRIKSSCSWHTFTYNTIPAVSQYLFTFLRASPLLVP